MIIDVNPYQPRRDFKHDELEDLMNSIKEHGLLQPLVVTQKGDRYELIAGERRLRAVKILELSTVPVIVRKAEEHEKLELALIENIQRSKLNPIEEAYAYRQLMRDFNFTQEQVAKKVGKSRPKIANAIRLLSLPEVINRLESISLGTAASLVAADAGAADTPVSTVKEVQILPSE